MAICPIHPLTHFFCSNLFIVSVESPQSDEEQGTISTDKPACAVQCCYDTFEFIHLC